jgi:hypothetical protein
MLRLAQYAVTGLALIALAACSPEPKVRDTGAKPTSGPSWLATPQGVPAALQPPKGNDVLLHHSHAVGKQIYVCTAGADGKFTWKPKPDAKLFDGQGREEGKHFAGPTWHLADGSKVVGEKVQEVAQPDACAWLLLKAKPDQSAGGFKDVTYIQRLNTTGGKAPTDPADEAHQGREVPVAYTADYYFYAAGK